MHQGVHVYVFFFFQAEDGIRDYKVTGVQTCALPISKAPRPGLILLDLNLPRRSGLEVLADVKSDHDLRSIPVVILTTSQAEEDIIRSYSLHANAYVTKPVDFERFSDALRQINDFFLTLVKLPNWACTIIHPREGDHE